MTTGAPSVIRVAGHGVARTAPEVATVNFTLRGEGAMAEAAVRALVERRTPIEAFLRERAHLTTGALVVTAARDKACDSDDGDGGPRLSRGACAIVGHIATLNLTARVTPVTEAGTLAGEVARLGGSDTRLNGFQLTDQRAARAAALTAAMLDARAQATAIAAASGVRIGRLRRVEDDAARSTEMNEVVVTGARVSRYAAPAPIAIGVSPAPIETEVTLTVEFEIAAPGP